MKDWLTKDILITVKAYPNPSKKYGETICVAGITIDDKKWVRLYPIPYRDLDEEQKFPKYAIIRAKISKPSDDKRPESFRVNADSIKVVDHLDTSDKWVKRKEIVLPTLDKSMCEILNKLQTENKSLGVFKPRDIKFYWQKARPRDEDVRKACYAQLSFFNKTKNAIEVIPFDFRFKFFCQEEPECKGHDFSIIDWEIGQAYRSWRTNYKTEDLLLEKIKERWLDRICFAKNDIYFYVGNMKRFRDNFMILGVFYPSK
ncbi:hypothetical protein COS91_02845 [Candidatus Desantisbacteria bacterium CG07_land_8_20_14_0_80_39_15]|uniref:Uncharacterized protein n=1 Tax=Candidatus Desantisbacteria bacterium CG07_land_8_20_14_0_80_39_15 TaxID=1974549 RepID=A0A2M6ZH99_9BACT|nr:MAG: hypothetical protein COS91_02845 [Candidatus Desantisbacteria bacterium CG07_land_8_20_14_0_80_39_15]